MVNRRVNRVATLLALNTAVVTLAVLYTPPVMAADIPVRQIQQQMVLKGSGANALSLPTDVAVAGNGNIYVVDSGHHRVVVFDRSGDRLSSFGGYGINAGELRNPVGVDVDGNGNVYVADKGNRRIQVYNGKGVHLRAIALQKGSKKIEPVDVAVSEKHNRIYVTGNNTHSIHVLNMSGRYISTWGGEGSTDAKFRFPATLARSSTARNVYIVDVLNSRVQVFTENGKHILNVGEWGVKPGQLFRPKGVALDDKGNVYISDSYMEVVQVFDVNHRFRYVLKRDGKLNAFEAPVGMTTDNNGRLYVVEMTANKVSVFSLE